MARRTRAQKVKTQAGSIAIGEVFGYAILTSKLGHGALGITVFLLFSVGVWLFWILLIVPTTCGYWVEGRGCRKPVNGKLHGCHFHGGAKHDAVLGAFGLPNPGRHLRPVWGGPAEAAHSHRTGRYAPAAAVGAGDGNASQTWFNSASLFVASVGSVAGVLALFVAT